MKEDIVQDEKLSLIGKLAFALYSQKIQITYGALKKILQDKGYEYSEMSNQGLGASVSAAYRAWNQDGKGDVEVSNAIAYTFTDKNGDLIWQK
ncbi:hypothetical protein [Microscilla marina]|uniref:Uncharacterized protein n=1 Tax=Microscilla marina ATCC 23134 TaxID=313606 RepID=A1ZVB1_MICM2|nr:hypothetical protein [Microscilla marina]EAY25609.1 hypothetical protein M23134_07260 [Microscilla marina ATCC 23134]